MGRERGKDGGEGESRQKEMCSRRFSTWKTADSPWLDAHVPGQSLPELTLFRRAHEHPLAPPRFIMAAPSSGAVPLRIYGGCCPSTSRSTRARDREEHTKLVATRAVCCVPGRKTRGADWETNGLCFNNEKISLARAGTAKIRLSAFRTRRCRGRLIHLSG